MEPAGYWALVLHPNQMWRTEDTHIELYYTKSDAKRGYVQRVIEDLSEWVDTDAIRTSTNLDEQFERATRKWNLIEDRELEIMFVSVVK